MSLWVLFLAASCIYGIAGSLLLWHIPFCRTGTSAVTSLSIVIPARNEEKRLPRLLESLKREQRSLAGTVSIQIIVADDFSSDSTVAIAQSFGCDVLSAKEEEAAEAGSPVHNPQEEATRAGKSGACWTGAEHADGDFLMFLDADTEFEKDGLSRVLGTYKGGLVSVQPFHRMERVYETLSSFFNIVVMAGVKAFTPFSREGKPFGCFGPCLLCRKDDYTTAGGHKAIQDELVDDIALARQFIKHGLPVYCYGGLGAVNFRMYPGGLRELLEGWTKNMGTAAGMSAPVVNVLLFVWIAGMTNLFLAFGKAFGLASPTAVVLSFAVYAMYCLQVFIHLRRIAGRPLLPCVFFPAYMVFFIGLFFYSVFRTLVVKTVRWRGRTIRISKARIK